ncbi:MAG: hypothetical protein JWN48_507 [Myxococcaceae bacterium]|nr:hypothetical protein [Myxococcaceae bacterium]
MRLFTCGNCGQTVFFENVRCTSCGHVLAYLPDAGRVSAIEPVEGHEGVFTALSAKAADQQYRLCENSVQYGVCNWAVPVQDANPLCECCRLNDVIPDLSKPKNLTAWQNLEAGKRRLFHTLRALRLPVESRVERPTNGLTFSFMEDTPDGKKVFTGHNDGEIVINISEADDPFREKLRKQLGEGYRTVLGHFRHEIGHYYWDRLVKDSPFHPPCRALFGDESVDYQESVKKHYSNPPPSDWPLHYVSSYATMHPWEDWAETWAHYLHMVDTLETARSYGLVLRPKALDGAPQKEIKARAIDFDDFDDLLSAWVPLTVALNSLNRSMGLIDPYPFVLSVDVIEKLRFVHDVVEHANASAQVQQQVASEWAARKASGEKTPEPAGTADSESQSETVESKSEATGETDSKTAASATQEARA